MSFKIRSLGEIRPKQADFGVFREVFGIDDYRGASVRYVQLRKGKTHHHENTTEIYIPVSGRGKLYIDGEELDLVPGESVMILPGTRHRAESPDGNLEMWVVSSPANDPLKDYVKGKDLTE